LTRRFFDEQKKKVQIVPITGAAEITPTLGVADLITDLTDTGVTLRQNHLRMIDVIFDSCAVLVGCPHLKASQSDLVQELVAGLKSVMDADRKRYLMANVPKAKLSQVTKILPGLTGPTVMEVAVQGIVAVHAVVEELDINRIIPALKGAGATGILVLPIERLVP
jgi:ATP phosphoribosyltransferase